MQTHTNEANGGVILMFEDLRAVASSLTSRYSSLGYFHAAVVFSSGGDGVLWWWDVDGGGESVGGEVVVLMLIMVVWDGFGFEAMALLDMVVTDFVGGSGNGHDS
ncbi:Hypothetical predicted protein [Olea europaea subsp. europaea]|uniref:Uncharacterized protein n=1 Tax=Olea europaea subsp. europaea TaxID=158383 RepID=A0A8S0U183_OLEEU|nr:Hypothetical predicted protein [Olea europaea subsp. europaea]